ncbi:universal stress protein UspA [Paraburkholderia ginsengiterrae]|uniref:Universal stress protein UspA n=1 Tax=Paraburkholderia ginsengiterrae TaxID=1462993 RepID=A0A1A9N334_9BURK|nr:universal stress protein [Paraburkholderia ginsengiterrae]OAJ56915.1 universal stress protein UspA [Paraburkholderia ginsengiterrae]OAJ56971.1 universal stress protein UspA [Paraburkholderia ginsengiterrae]
MLAPFSRILLCYDGTPEGQRALRCGAMLARQLQAETHLLSIMDTTCWSNGFGVLASASFEMDERDARKTLEEGIVRLHAWGVSAQGHFEVGSAVEHIARLAHAIHADLIVLGHQPQGVFARWWTGENHAGLLDRVPCRVLFEVADSLVD